MQLKRVVISSQNGGPHHAGYRIVLSQLMSTLLMKIWIEVIEAGQIIN